MCCQFASLEPRAPEAEHYRKGAGADAGVECFTRFPDGQETGWQVKYYWDVHNLLRDLDSALNQALTKHPMLTRYVVCIPFDLSDARTGRGKTPLEKWQAWRDRKIKKATESSRRLTIELWNASTLKERLTREPSQYAGRTFYWFNQQLLTVAWFQQKFESAAADLGNRYTADTSVTLPIRRALLGLARDPDLHRQMETWVRDIFRHGRSAVQSATLLAEVTAPLPADFAQSLLSLEATLPSEPPTASHFYPLKQCRDALNAAARALERTFAWLYNNADGVKDAKDRRDRAYRDLRELHNSIHSMSLELEGESWAYVNQSQILVHGGGGVGKSHLLADVAAYQIERCRPAVLLLGQNFTEGNPWDQILRELDMPAGTSTQHFLGALDAAAQAAGVRGLILVDALNERKGTALWPSRLAGFLKQVEAFPHLGVILSCRTTYLAHVIPDSLTEEVLPRLEHHGFGSKDARAYLKARGFVLPGAPVPAPELNVPLFLKTLCDALERNQQREFPRGMTGVTAIFSFYRDAVQSFVERRLQLDTRRKIVKRAIEALAEAMAWGVTERLPVEQVQPLFDAILPSQADRNRDLLTQLESEGMLTVEVDDDGAEVVRFTFQRFSDHVIAARLIDVHIGAASPAAAFAADAPLLRYVTEPLAWEMAGVVEALAVQLPERFGQELPDLLPAKTSYSVQEAFRESLLWRAQQNFTQRTLDLVHRILGEKEVLSILLHVATEPDNQFNGLYLHDQLKAWPMPERDAKWSIPISLIGADEHSPIMTLIEWAWSNGFDVIEDRRAELAGITLSWCLTTSNRTVRDRATKALSSLMAKRPNLAANLLARFWEIDDDYLRERLLAAIYGALLQGMMDEGTIGTLALAVYTTLFDAGAPPLNTLIRDHGRGIVEYALWRQCLPPEVDLTKARPPYRSPWPLEHIPNEIIENYTDTYGSGARYSDQIVSSAVQDGDFARYVIDSHVRNWSPAPLGVTRLPSDPEVGLSWLADFSATASPEAVTAFMEMAEKAKLLNGRGRWEQTPEREAFEESERAFRSTITSDAWEDYRVSIQPWIANGMGSWAGRSTALFNQRWARRWVCMRAHDLGWSEQLHGAFDRGRQISHGRMSHSVERIGKKYQWLSLYELGGRLADNCAFIGGRNAGEAPGSYPGETCGSLRDIDPSLLAESAQDDGGTRFDEPVWWSPIHPVLKASTPTERLQWLHSQDGMINDVRCIDVAGRDSGRWLVLHSFTSVGERPWGDDERGMDSWARINCVVVKRRDLSRLLRGLQTKRLSDPHALPFIEIYGHEHYIGEYPWHTSFSDFSDWEEPGDGLGSLPTAARPTVTEYTCERGGYDGSIDDAIRVEMPAPWLIRDMELHMSDGRRPTFLDRAGSIRFFDPALTEQGPHAALVDREAFLRTLDKAGLAPVWVIAGEKNVYGGDGKGFGGRLNFTSLYWQQDGDWEIKHYTYFEPPAKKQVETLFGGPVPSWVPVCED